MARKHDVLSEQYTQALNRVDVPEHLVENVYQQMRLHQNYVDSSNDIADVEVVDYQITPGISKSAMIVVSLCVLLIVGFVYLSTSRGPDESSPLSEYAEEDLNDEGHTEDDAYSVNADEDGELRGDDRGGSFQLIIRYDD